MQLVFRNETLDFQLIHIIAVQHVREYSCSSTSQFGEQLIIHNFTIFDNPFLFVSAVGTSATAEYGTGFYITNSTFNFICPSCCNNSAESDIEAKALALISAMGSSHVLEFHIKTIFIDNADLHRAITSND